MFQIASLPRSLAACQRDLESTNVQIRIAVVLDLTKAHPESERDARVKLLVKSLEDENGAVRRQGLLGLADMRADDAIEAVGPLLHDVDFRVRQMAILCLGEIAEPGDQAVIRRVAPFFHAQEPALRYQALLALGQLAPTELNGRLLEALGDGDLMIEELALRLVDEALVAQGLEITTKLKEQVKGACLSPNLSVKAVAQLVAGELGWDAPHDMIGLLVRGKFRPREPRDEQRAIYLAGRLGLTDLEPSLNRRAFGWFGFSLDPFRWVALSSLIRLGSQDAWQRVLKGLKAKKVSERTSAVICLGEAGDPRGLPLLEQYRGKDDWMDQEVLAAAVDSLSNRA